MLESVEWLNAESQRRVLAKVTSYKYHLSYDQQAFNDSLLSHWTSNRTIRSFRSTGRSGGWRSPS